ncbi:MAG TPA: hypothetical protein VNZ94_01900 [Xanthobacteraceae bacterium]|nr:hypothetical protein [Xanthobacteraceae bacterium]
MTPPLPSPFLQSAPADASAAATSPALPQVAAAEALVDSFDAICQQLALIADQAAEPRQILDQVYSRFRRELVDIVADINREIVEAA